MVKIKTASLQPHGEVIHNPKVNHPFSKARQFQRTLNAVKMNKMFAKPLVGVLQGHTQGINVLKKCSLALNKFISGSHDGQIKIWDITKRKSIISTYAHTQSIKGVSFNSVGSKFLSSSQDKSIHLYDFKKLFAEENEFNFRIGGVKGTNLNVITKYLSKYVLGNVDHSPSQHQFVTSGQFVQIWSYERTKPIYKLEWNIDSILSVRYNKAQQNLLCGTGSDRSVILYDVRSQCPMQKIYLPNKAMCACFNPIQPMNLTVGNDDSNCYSFDLRKMDKARMIHKDHIGAVVTLQYSPTGKQFVTGSFDRTLRIFPYDLGRSIQVYHTKRMQIVSTVEYSVDARYILSGSEDMNIRIWKSKAWNPLGITTERQQRAINYREKIIEKFKNSVQIRKIKNYRHLPKYIMNAKKKREDKNVSKFKKKINKQANTGIKQNLINEKKLIVEEIQIKSQKQKKKRQKKQGIQWQKNQQIASDQQQQQ